jgi:hypothetical protein
LVSAPAVPSFARAAELLEEFVETARRGGGGAPVLLAAHNARQFDAGFLQAEYRRLGRELPDDWRFVDTLPLARRQLDKDVVGKFNLESLAKHFNVVAKEGETAHRAGADARVLGDILQGILGVRLEGSVGAGAGGDAGKLRAAAELLAAHSFSLGDPAKNNLRRVTAASAAPPAANGYGGGRFGGGGGGGGGGVAGNNVGFGATPIVSSTGAKSDVATAAAATELDELELTEGEDDEDADTFYREVFNAVGLCTLNQVDP